MDDLLFRKAMGKFATGVTVITTGKDEDIRGMTANAFMSVSLDPQFIVVSIKNDARILKEIQQNNTFSVSILNADQEYESKVFAGQIKDGTVNFDYLDEQRVIKDALAQVACELSNEHVEGDHTLLIGKVKAIEIRDGNPLLFFNGSYEEIKEPLSL